MQFDTIYKDILPLGNLHILEQNNASAILAIFFSLGMQGFNTFYKSEVLQNLCEKYCKTRSFKGILQVQYTLLLNIEHTFKINPKFIQEILKQTLEHLETLEQNHLAHNENLAQIKAYFSTLLTQDTTQQIKTNVTQNKDFLEDFFHTGLKQLVFQKNILQEILTHYPYLTAHLKALDSALQKAQTQDFSIGVTGVLSAGKSTFLNALLGQEILGSSTIPETASLTLLKYGKTPSAKVCFWNQQEWEDLKLTLDSTLLEGLLQNVEFQQNIKAYIKENAFSKEIDVKDLPQYTSANHPSKLCYLIKETTLFTPLEFLENHIQIVDTPGLDDPVIQREEITKKYLLSCDLLIHTMNASQSATQIDMDFIFYTLEYANVARILILLTHADLLEKKDLESALTYTKESIHANLLKHLPKDKAELLFKRLYFLSIASYPALLCKINPKYAQEKGYNLKDSNFEALITYLNVTLLGNNSIKAKDTIYLCAETFLRHTMRIKESLTLEKDLLFAKENDIAKISQEQHAQKEALMQQINTTNILLNATQTQLNHYLATLEKQSTQKLENAKNILSERIFDDIMYDYTKNKTPNKERLEYLLDLGLKDLLSEILRFSTQSLNKKITQLKEQFSAHLQSFSTQPLEFANFNLYCDSTSLERVKLQLVNGIAKQTQKFNKHQSIALKEAIDIEFSTSFKTFSKTLLTQNKTLENTLIQNFKDTLNAIRIQQEELLKEREASLQNALKNLTTSTQEKEQKLAQLTHTNNALNTALECYKNLQIYATY